MLIRFTVAILLLLTGQSSKAGWTTLEPVRQQQNNSALSDILSQVDANTAAVYRGEDDINTGHETCHAVHSRIRNSLGVKNGYYMLKGSVFTIGRPNFTLTDLARAIPADKRGNDYQTYLVQATKGGRNYEGWSDPFYVLDELIAYTNGTVIGLSYDGSISQQRIDAATSYQNMLEMWEYAKVAQEMCRKTGFAEQKELDEFLDFVYNKRILWLEKQYKAKCWIGP